MTPGGRPARAVRADGELRERLIRLLPGGAASGSAPGAVSPGVASPAELPQPDADALLAHLVWSRLVEPGDGVAGALIDALGAAESLELVASGTGAARLCAIAADGASGGDGAAGATGMTGAAGVTGVTGAAGADVFGGPGGSHEPGTADADAPEDDAPGPLTPARVRAGLGRWLPRLSRAASLEDMDRGIAAGLRFVSPGSLFWPDSLQDLGPHAPLGMWIRGEPELLAAFSLAVVGARACTGYGAHVTAELVDGVASAGVAIVSGAAYGVDAVAHRTALACGAPTVAVLAGGADRPYPAAHAELLQRIGASGLVCSEMAPGSAPTRWRFLQRNRLIAALARATLVTEAGVRSGSLNSAGHTAELGRMLGAVPGPVTSAASAGCHRLIREYGATLVTNAAEARELLGLAEDDALFGLGLDGRAPSRGRDAPRSVVPAPHPRRSAGPAPPDGGARHPTATSEPAAQPPPRQPALHRRIIDALPLRGSRRTEEVGRLAGVDARSANGALAELELLGYVVRRETPEDGETGWALLRRE
ncbi:DNA-processing protein DprA [Leucobacter allii]|uniref:DNA-processing protein DprA n=1 Tax=Leucobacter allii TaxID=2932247 RepID=UPI001FD61091|nr:DNA-processing protein DprA [Leucobacter allii]UOR00296.1 DNA-processing protein DprA [Leucobacter allii]